MSMNKRNLLIALGIAAVAIFAVVVLVPRDSGYPASADYDCPPSYGYDGEEIPCEPEPRPLLYKWLDIGEETPEIPY
jgi:hypothetical protein